MYNQFFIGHKVILQTSHTHNHSQITYIRESRIERLSSQFMGFTCVITCLNCQQMNEIIDAFQFFIVFLEKLHKYWELSDTEKSQYMRNLKPHKLQVNSLCVVQQRCRWRRCRRCGLLRGISFVTIAWLLELVTYRFIGTW